MIAPSDPYGLGRALCEQLIRLLQGVPSVPLDALSLAVRKRRLGAEVDPATVEGGMAMLRELT